MSALDRLRAIEISRETAHSEPSKPTKAPFDGFVGATPQPSPDIHAVSDDPANDPTAEFRNQYAHAREDCDEGAVRRRARALAMLDADPGKHIAVVAEAGDPAHVAVAIRGVAVGELTISAERYDAFALMALMEQYGHA